jgi:hypothetical protein
MTAKRAPRKSPRGEHVCDLCGVPTDFRGWYFVMRRPRAHLDPLLDMKKVYHWWCKAHFIENMFGLWPYVCTAACRKSHSKQVNIRLDEDDMRVWLQLETTLVPARTLRANESVLLKSLGPKCPWCSRPMRFDKRQHERRVALKAKR